MDKKTGISYLRLQLSDFQVELVQVFVHKGDERLDNRKKQQTVNYLCITVVMGFFFVFLLPLA